MQGDSPLLPGLLSQIPEAEEIATVTADGAYDTRRCHTAIIEHGADAFPVSSITVGGLTFEINSDDVRKKGVLVGHDGQTRFSMPLANGLALTGAGRVKLGYVVKEDPDHSV